LNQGKSAKTGIWGSQSLVFVPRLPAINSPFLHHQTAAMLIELGNGNCNKGLAIIWPGFGRVFSKAINRGYFSYWFDR